MGPAVAALLAKVFSRACPSPPAGSNAGAHLPSQIINTYTEAVQTVDPFKATGKTHTLWVSFAKFYEDNGQIEDVSVAGGAE